MPIYYGIRNLDALTKQELRNLAEQAKKRDSSVDKQAQEEAHPGRAESFREFLKRFDYSSLTSKLQPYAAEFKAMADRARKADNPEKP